MSNMPNWLKKPRHRKHVIATDRGWVVEETGELLVSVVNMKQKMEKYFGDDLEVKEQKKEEEKKRRRVECFFRFFFEL